MALEKSRRVYSISATAAMTLFARNPGPEPSSRTERLEPPADISETNLEKNSSRHGRLDIAVSSHADASDIFRRSMGLGTSEISLCCITFDMRGGRKWAKPACGRPLDGRVRPRVRGKPLRCCA